MGALLRVFDDRRRRAGQAPGSDGLTYGHLGRGEAASVFRAASRAVLAGTYKPHPYRTVPIPKPDGTKRTLRLPTVVDGTVAASLHQHLSSYWETVLSPYSHGFRTGRSTWTLLAALEAQVTLGGLPVVVNDDLTGAFDNVRVEDVMCVHRANIANDALLRLVEAVVRGDRQHNTIGIAQGSAYSPTALEVTLGPLDQRWTADPANPPLLRYADNSVLLCRDVPEGRRARARYKCLVESAGFSLKESGDETTHVIDLSAGGQTRLLGFDLSLRDGLMRYGIGEDAWETLRANLMLAHRTPNPPLTALQAVNGWIAYLGPAFNQQSATTLTDAVLTAMSAYGFRESNAGSLRDQ